MSIDMFAAAALQGLLADSGRYPLDSENKDKNWHSVLAVEAYDIAEVMVEERRERRLNKSPE